MTDQHRFLSAGHFDEDLYANSRTGERVLNAAIVQADISLSFEDYLEIFNTFYADDIEVSSDTAEESIRGKDRVRVLLLNFLVPLHVKTCTLSWRTFRKWNGAHVVYEHHYDQQQTGGPLTSDDLSLDVADPIDGFRGPSKAAS